MKAALITSIAALAATAVADWPHAHKPNQHANGLWHMVPNKPDSAPPATMGNSTFKQPIDHSNPSLGTFEQFYFYDTTYWKGPGSPVVIFTPGEVNASYYTDYLTTNRTTGVVAQEIGAATIVIEHRYWGTSTPFDELTTANLQYLTLENAIADFVNFAQNVQLPFTKGQKSNAADVPWVWIGGSYSGALSAWIESTSPGTFWAYLASSAPVEAISNYYGYFLPVELGMPKNCSKDMGLVIKHMDEVLTTGSPKEVSALKTQFGLEGVEHNDDFMAALENGPWLWQGNQFYENEGFFTFCDYIEDSVNATKVPGAEGVGLTKALEGYAKWSKTFFVDYCAGTYGYYKGAHNLQCLDTYNASSPVFTDISLANTGERQWTWMCCNEPFGYWQTGNSQSYIVSDLVTAEYWIRQCSLYFPTGPQGQTFGANKGRTQTQLNKYTGGWDISNSTRLIYGNGGFDPWREAGVSSSLRPGGPLQSTPQIPVNVVPGGFHTSDLVTANGVVNAGCKAVIDKEVAQLTAWVKQWPGSSPPPYPPNPWGPWGPGGPGGRIFRA